MEVELERYQEYRIEASETQKIRVMVVSGLAEIKGQELLNDRWYVFSNIKTSIFTFTGAKLKTDGNCELQYKTTQPFFLKAFEYFDNTKDTPKTALVLGKGRSTFCASVINYFIRIHKKVDFIELDPGRGNIFPGALSHARIDYFVDYTEGIKLNNITSYFYGNTTINNPELFDLQTTVLANNLKDISEMADDPSGCPGIRLIICPELGVDTVNLLVKKFKAVEVVVVGDERMFHKLNFIVDKTFIPNMGYVMENNVFRSINKYFNGINNEFTPCSFIFKNDWMVIRVGEMFSAPESALPLGSSRKVGKTDICKADLTENAILAISSAEKEEDIVSSPVLGFIVCLDEKKFRILCIQPKLPKAKYLIQGHLKYIDF